MDVVEKDNPGLTKTTELRKIAQQAEKFELTVTFELKSGTCSTYKIVGRGGHSHYECERVGYKGHEFDVDLDRAMEDLIAHVEVVKMVALVVKTSKGSTPSKILRPIAIAAWAEKAKIPVPPEDSVSKEVETAKSKQQSMRETLLADLRGGPEGLKRWESRLFADKAIAKHLKESDLSGVDLRGVSFHKSGVTYGLQKGGWAALLDVLDLQGSNFEGTQLTDASLTGCDLSECNFRSAIMDGANLRSIGGTLTDFSGSSLVKALLMGATLTGANFASANLKEADFGYADLRGANLATANLTDVHFENTRYDEHTRWPADYVPPPDPNAANPHAVRALVFAGKGRDPFLMQQVKALAPPGGNLDFETFVSRLEKEFDQERLKKSLKMLKAESFQLFAEVAPDSLVGVVKSQTDASLVYSCRLSENGNYSCCTQNLNPCGGLRGALCKHLLVLLIGITKAGELSPASACEWVLASRRFRNANLDKDIMSATFLRYKGAEAGELDWRPTETMPEDYYAF